MLKSQTWHATMGMLLANDACIYCEISVEGKQGGSRFGCKMNQSVSYL